MMMMTKLILKQYNANQIRKNVKLKFTKRGRGVYIWLVNQQSIRQVIIPIFSHQKWNLKSNNNKTK